MMVLMMMGMGGTGGMGRRQGEPHEEQPTSRRTERAMGPERFRLVREFVHPAVRLRNDLPAATTIHWHGLAVRNDMDGVPDLTQPVVKPGAAFDYRFVVPDAGTYWFHPHMGLQLDRALYAPLIVEEKDDPGKYDIDHVERAGRGRRPRRLQPDRRSSTASASPTATSLPSTPFDCRRVARTWTGPSS